MKKYQIIELGKGAEKLIIYDATLNRFVTLIGLPGSFYSFDQPRELLKDNVECLLRDKEVYWERVGVDNFKDFIKHVHAEFDTPEEYKEYLKEMLWVHIM